MSEYQSKPTEKIVKPDGSSIYVGSVGDPWHGAILISTADMFGFLWSKFSIFKGKPTNASIPQPAYWLTVDQQLQIMKWRQFLTTKLRSGSWCLLPVDDTAGHWSSVCWKILLWRDPQYPLLPTMCQCSVLGLGRYRWCKQFEWQEDDKWLMSFAGLDYVPEAEGRVPELHLPVRTQEYSENRWHRTALVVANVAVMTIHHYLHNCPSPGSDRY